MAECVCTCGNIFTISKSEFRVQKTCGCFRSKKIKSIRLRNIWSGMKTRCTNPNRHNYHKYGGRGIKVCDKWQKFDVFQDWALKNGYSDDLSIDRIDSNGNYEPSNCRWANIHEQSSNLRSNNDVVGVSKVKNQNSWHAYLWVDNVRVLSKYFKTYNEAVHARKKAEIDYNIYDTTTDYRCPI